MRVKGEIKNWYDRDIVAGTDWEKQTLHHLAHDEIILLLISADFMNSTYCNAEMLQAIDRHNAGQARVLPILVRPTDYEGAPFTTIQMVPGDSLGVRPVTRWADRDEAWRNVVREIRKAIRGLQGGTAITPYLADPSDRIKHMPLTEEGNI
jgi:hypothetical protein